MKKKYFFSGLLLTLAVFVLSACSQKTTTTTPKTNDEGFFHHYFVIPFIKIIHFTADHVGGSYGLAVIIVTLVIRLILLPFMLKTFRKQQIMKEKMSVIKPEMTALQAKMKNAKNKEEQMKYQQEIMGLYKKHGVNPLNIGCLPLLIQMPILMAFYYSMRGNADIASQNFLWFGLGHPDIIMTIIAGILYYIQFRVSMMNMDEDQQKQMKLMGLISPIMIVVVSFRSPAVLPLYWAVGALFLIGQQYFAQRFYKNHPVTEEKKSK